MNKILAGAEEALAFVRGEKPAARIYTALGGPYVKDEKRTLIQHKSDGYYIVWNWETGSWDKVLEPVQVIGPNANQ